MTLSILIWSTLAIFAFINLMVYLALALFLLYVLPDKVRLKGIFVLRLMFPDIFGIAVRYSIAWVVAYWLVLFLSWALFKHTATLAVRLFDFCVASSILVVGLTTNVLKKANQKLYGVFEIGFAWFSAISLSTRINLAHIELTTLMGLVGTVYVVSRGFENIFAAGVQRKEAFSKFIDETKAEYKEKFG